jgi:Tol biopolymer transport system component
MNSQLLIHRVFLTVIVMLCAGCIPAGLRVVDTEGLKAEPDEGSIDRAAPVAETLSVPFIAFQSNRTARHPKEWPVADIPVLGPGLLDVYFVRADGSGLRRVSYDEPVHASFYRGMMRWSPDHTWLAWSGEQNVWVSSPLGETRQIADLPAAPGGLAWCRDSSRLVVWCDDRGEVFVCDIDTQVQTTFPVSTQGHLIDVDWSRDRVLFWAVSSPSDGSRVYAQTVDASVPQEIFSCADPILRLRCSPVSKELALLTGKREAASLCVLDVGTRTLVSIASDVVVSGQLHASLWSYSRSRIMTCPAWAPNGTALTFEDDGRVFVIDRDGTCQRDITPAGLVAGSAAWSSDGEYIVFHATSASEGLPGRHREWRIWRTTKEGEDPQQLTFGPGGDLYPAWAG